MQFKLHNRHFRTYVVLFTGGQVSDLWMHYVQIVSFFFQLNRREFYRYCWYKKQASEIV